jgi:GGDEF domain-containing protein
MQHKRVQVARQREGLASLPRGARAPRQARQRRKLSASIGVAVYPQDGEPIEALLQAADRELYAMKSGRAEERLLSVAR